MAANSSLQQTLQHNSPYDNGHSVQCWHSDSDAAAAAQTVGAAAASIGQTQGPLSESWDTISLIAQQTKASALCSQPHACDRRAHCRSACLVTAHLALKDLQQGRRDPAVPHVGQQAAGLPTGEAVAQLDQCCLPGPLACAVSDPPLCSPASCSATSHRGLVWGPSPARHVTLHCAETPASLVKVRIGKIVQNSLQHIGRVRQCGWLVQARPKAKLFSASQSEQDKQSASP